MKTHFGKILIVLLLHSEILIASTSNTLSVEEFLKKVQYQSPEIQIEESVAEASRAKSNGIRISPPMLGLMTMSDSGGRNQGFEITQEIPFPSKIKNEKNVRVLESKAQEIESNFKKNEILLNAKKAYFEFWKSFENKKILENKRAWLKKHVQMSRSLTRVESSGQIHLLANESELDQLENDIIIAQSELFEKINLLKLFVPELQTDNLVPEASLNIENIHLDKKQKFFAIETKESSLGAAGAALDLNKQAYLPDFVVRYRSYNGNDMNPRSEEIMIGMSLPFIYFWQPNSEISESKAKFRRAELEVAKEKLKIFTQLEIFRTRSTALQNQIENLKSKLIPRAYKRVKIIENLTIRSIESLDEHRMVMLDYLDLQQKAIIARFELEVNNIEILKITTYSEDLK